MPERLTGEAWATALHNFRETAWRWEAQGVYREPYEQGPLQQFLAGHKPDLSFMDGWLSAVRQGAGAGRRYARVRVLTDPLTDYLRFENSFTHLNVAAGEAVRVITDTRRRELELSSEDFWLFDDEWAAPMHFDDEGFTHADVITDTATLNRFREIRDLAWKDAVRFGDHMTK
ncbi:MAG: hypothetical protein GEU98_01615 [Pseudonocardiaceae bacterium]|nr:hypothetical protein [Pseudonocardiaceae bacterium]